MYIVFVARNLEQVVSYYTAHGSPVPEAESEANLKYYMLGMLPLLILLGIIRNLKLLTPFSMLANILIATGMGITFYYLFKDLKAVESLPKIADWKEIPSFFGMAIFALEGIGVVSTKKKSNIHSQSRVKRDKNEQNEAKNEQSLKLNKKLLDNFLLNNYLRCVFKLV